MTPQRKHIFCAVLLVFSLVWAQDTSPTQSVINVADSAKKHADTKEAGTAQDTLDLAAQPVKIVVETVFVSVDTICAYGRDEIFSFAEHLYELGEFERAAVEFLRLSFHYTDDTLATISLFRAAHSLERAGKFALAREQYRNLASLDLREAKKFATYRIPLTFLLEERPESALATIDTSAEVYGAGKYLIGWAHLQEHDYPKALATFTDLSKKASDSDISGSLDFLIHRTKERINQGDRSAFVAGFLSALVPGLGRGYSGRWGDGFFSFAVISATSGISYATWEDDRTFAVVSAALAAFFYVGNVYGSARGAKVENMRRHELFMRKLWEQTPHPPTLLYSSPSSNSF